MKSSRTRWAVVAVGCLSLVSAAAREATEKGEVRVRVVNADGAPLEGVQVVIGVWEAGDSNSGAGGTLTPRSAVTGGRYGARGLQSFKTVASTTSDKDGRAAFKAVDPGSYRIAAGNPSVGREIKGVEVVSGKTVEVTLTPKK